MFRGFANRSPDATRTIIGEAPIDGDLSDLIEFMERAAKSIDDLDPTQVAYLHNDVVADMYRMMAMIAKAVPEPEKSKRPRKRA